jgi:hypothetical protein
MQQHSMYFHLKCCIISENARQWGFDDDILIIFRCQSNCHSDDMPITCLHYERNTHPEHYGQLYWQTDKQEYQHNPGISELMATANTSTALSVSHSEAARGFPGSHASEVKHQAFLTWLMNVTASGPTWTLLRQKYVQKFNWRMRMELTTFETWVQMGRWHEYSS